MENNKENQSLFNEYYYGNIDTIVKTINEHLEKALSTLETTIDLNDFYRGISYSTMTYLNTVLEGGTEDEIRERVTNSADKFMKEFINENSDLTYKELYVLPLLMMDIASYTIFSTIKDRENRLEKEEMQEQLEQSIEE